MNNKDLSKDILFHNRVDVMSLQQRCKYDIMLFVSHLSNVAISGLRERSSGDCLDMQFTVFLDKFREAFNHTISMEKKCGNVIWYDDFVRIAVYSFVAIKDILLNPSTQIEKITKKLPISSTAGFNSKTIQWMAQRPGRTIAEKVSPENKVLTQKTIFSVDTKENRQFMYLYRILHEVMRVRLHDTRCQNCCNSKECSYVSWISDINKLLRINNKLRLSELSTVRPVKQTQQNNKLMCDKNYKIIWDSVKMLSGIEDKIEYDYKDHLEDRFAMVFYWIILAQLLACEGVKIHDYIGTLNDRDGLLWFGNKESVLSGEAFTELIVFNSSGLYSNSYFLKLKNKAITLSKKNDEVLYSYNTEHFFLQNASAMADNLKRYNLQQTNKSEELVDNINE